jgi:hypothetical protein
MSSGTVTMYGGSAKAEHEFIANARTRDPPGKVISGAEAATLA